MSDASDRGSSDVQFERAAAGDPLAFAKLFGLHEAELRRYVRRRMDKRLQGRFDESDVIQATRLDAYRYLRGFVKRRPMPFGHWLRRTAIQRYLDLRRLHFHASTRSVCRELTQSSADAMLARTTTDEAESPSAALLAQEERVQLYAALRDLQPTDRELLYLRYVEHLPNRAVAEKLGIDDRDASKRHATAILRLAKLMRRA